MRLGDAHRQAPKPARLVGVELPCGHGVVFDATRAVDPQRDRLDLLAERRGVGIKELEGARLLGGRRHHLGQLGGPFAPLDEVVAHGRPDPEVFGQLADGAMLRGMVSRKCIDGDDGRDAVDLDVLHLLAEIGGAGEHVVRVLSQQLRRQGLARHHPVLPRVNFQRAHGGDDDRRVRRQARGAALDVEEPFRSHVSAEARLGDDEIAAVDAHHVSQD